MRSLIKPLIRSNFKTTINGTQGSEPVVNYVARLDGVSQYWQLSEDIVIPANTDFTLEVEGSFDYGNNTAWLAVVYGNDGSRIAFSKISGVANDIRPRFGNVEYRSGILWLEGVNKVLTASRVGSSVTFNYNGQDYTIDSDESFIINSLGSLSGAGDFVDGYFKRLSVTIDGTLTNEINLTNKDRGATQLPTVGSVSATMPNYTSDVWEVAP